MTLAPIEPERSCAAITANLGQGRSSAGLPLTVADPPAADGIAAVRKSAGQSQKPPWPEEIFSDVEAEPKRESSDVCHG